MRRCAIAKTVLGVVGALLVGGLLAAYTPRPWWLPRPPALAMPFLLGLSIGLQYFGFSGSCRSAIARGEPWHYFIPKPWRSARLVSLLVLVALLAGCATHSPELEQKLDAMSSQLEAMKAQQAKPPAPTPAPITSQQVTIAGAVLPKDCGVLERSDVSAVVRPPAYAALLICTKKPSGVQVVTPAKKPEPKK